MPSKIFLIDDAGNLQEMAEAPYTSEDDLQNLLAAHPHLLPGDLIDEEHPRRWLLVRREVGIPDRESGALRWSLDHLFLDQDGVPTLVEVKRASDTRLRREVVGQLLDYAANGVLYWPIERLRALFEAECEDRAESPDDRLRQHLASPDADLESFWQQVKTNLQAGKIRLIFLADEIPMELRRVVEFLNEQMDPAEVLAVSIGHFSGRGFRTLVPRLVGRTAAAETRKSPRSSEKWNEESFFAALEARFGAESATVRGGRRLYDWARSRCLPGWGTGARMGSCSQVIDVAGERYLLYTLWTYGKIELHLKSLRRRPPFDDDDLWYELIDKLAAVPGIVLPADAAERLPSAPLAIFAEDQSFESFTDVVEWFTTQLQMRSRT